MKCERGMISVIVPVFNVELYLEKCIDSIINQTYQNLEIILVDDGSTDRSGGICDAYVKKDGRVRVCHKCNGGLSSARNTGLDMAAGEYIGFVDSDDYIAPDMYESLCSFLSEDVDLVCCGIVRTDKRGHRTVTGDAKHPVYLDHQQSVKELLLRRHLAFSACDKLMKRTIIGELRFPQNRVCEDLPFTYNVVKRCKKTVNIGSCKYFYNYRGDSISRKPFYARRIDYVLFAGDILKDVRSRYPSLRKEAEFLYIINMMSTIDAINDSSDAGGCEYMRERLVKAVKKMILLILLNPLLSCEQKKRCLQLK